MNRTTMLLVAILLAIGCSHAAPKSEKAQTALLSPPSAPPPAARPESTQRERDDDSAGNAIFFDFDSALIRDESRSTLQQIGRKLAHSGKSIRIEGNCDERGTTEYNLALGDRRARTAQNYLKHLGVPGRRISIVSYGSERPKASGHDERAWAQNRRDDFVIR